MARIEVFADPAALAVGAAQRVTWIVRQALSERATCSLVLAGGSTPRALYERLASEPSRSEIDWSRVTVFWGDERAVPPKDPASNYRMAREALLSKVPIADASVHRIAGELGAVQAAAAYEESLRQLFDELPARFDLVLLGLGSDGHTASLFPGTAALSGDDRLVVPTLAPEVPRQRVSLSFRSLNAARELIFLVQGADKADALRDSTRAGSHLPAARVRQDRGRLVWLVDRAAAELSVEEPAS